MSQGHESEQSGTVQLRHARTAQEIRAELAETGADVRRYLFSMCGDWHRAEDLAQEVVLKAWDRRATFNGQSQLKTWVFAIARNHWISSLRKHKRMNATLSLNDNISADSAGSPLAAAARGELAGAIAVAVAALPADQREALSLRENTGLTFAQVAGVLGVPVATAKSRVRYALMKLAELLEPFGRELEQ